PPAASAPDSPARDSLALGAGSVPCYCSSWRILLWPRPPAKRSRFCFQRLLRSIRLSLFYRNRDRTQRWPQIETLDTEGILPEHRLPPEILRSGLACETNTQMLYRLAACN